MHEWYKKLTLRERFVLLAISWDLIQSTNSRRNTSYYVSIRSLTGLSYRQFENVLKGLKKKKLVGFESPVVDATSQIWLDGEALSLKLKVEAEVNATIRRAV